jgi:hypothetical protein
MSESRYMTAQVCLNGHSTTDAIEQSPELTAQFCAQCGSETLTECPSCKTPIRGHYHVPGFFSLGEYQAPSYCHGCGQPFPWTAERLKAAKEHAGELEGLDAAERAQLQDAINDISKDGPRTELGATRFKKLMRKAGQTAASGLYKVALDLATDGAKKLLLGP